MMIFLLALAFLVKLVCGAGQPVISFLRPVGSMPSGSPAYSFQATVLNDGAVCALRFNQGGTFTTVSCSSSKPNVWTCASPAAWGDPVYTGGASVLATCDGKDGVPISYTFYPMPSITNVAPYTAFDATVTNHVLTLSGSFTQICVTACTSPMNGGFFAYFESSDAQTTAPVEVTFDNVKNQVQVGLDATVFSLTTDLDVTLYLSIDGGGVFPVTQSIILYTPVDPLDSRFDPEQLPIDVAGSTETFSSNPVYRINSPLYSLRIKFLDTVQLSSFTAQCSSQGRFAICDRFSDGDGAVDRQTYAVLFSLNSVDFYQLNQQALMYAHSDFSLNPASGSTLLPTSVILQAVGSYAIGVLPVDVRVSDGTSILTVITAKSATASQITFDLPDAATLGLDPQGNYNLVIEYSLNGQDFSPFNKIFSLANPGGGGGASGSGGTTTQVVDVLPRGGVANSGTTVTIVGVNFSSIGQHTIRWDTVVVSCLAGFISTTELHCPTPTSGAVAGTAVNFEYSEDNGAVYISTSSVAFNFYSAPSFSTVLPVSGPSTGGTVVTLTATGSLTVYGTVSVTLASSTFGFSMNVPGTLSGTDKIVFTAPNIESQAAYKPISTSLAISVSLNSDLDFDTAGGPVFQFTKSLALSVLPANSTTLGLIWVPYVPTLAVASAQVVLNSVISLNYPSFSAATSSLLITGLQPQTQYVATLFLKDAQGVNIAKFGPSSAVSTYPPVPVVQALTPTSFDIGGSGPNQTMTITGTDLNAQPVSITIGTYPLLLSLITLVNSTMITCSIPAGIGSKLVVTVATLGGSAVAPSFFSYNAPVITNILPLTGIVTLGVPQTITLLGSSLALSSNLPKITLSPSVTCKNITFVSASEVTCVVPALPLPAPQITVTLTLANTVATATMPVSSTALASWIRVTALASNPTLSSNSTAAVVYRTGEADDTLFPQFAVLLASPPESGFSVSVQGVLSNTAEAVLTPSSGILKFSETDYSTPQVIVVRGRDDAKLDGDIPYTLRIEESSLPQTLGNYSFVNADNEKLAVRLIGIDNAVYNRSSSIVFTVALDFEPNQSYRVDLQISDSTAGQLSRNTLDFAPGGGTTRQLLLTSPPQQLGVPVTARGLVLVVVTATLVNTSSVAQAQASFLDLDTATSAKVIISTPNPATFVEGRNISLFAAWNPSLSFVGEPVQIQIAINAADVSRVAAMSPLKMDITSANYARAQVFTLYAVPNLIDDGDSAVSLTLTVQLNANNSFVEKRDLTVVNDDTARFVITYPPGNNGKCALMENEIDDIAFSVELATQPVANVQIDIATIDPTRGLVANTTLEFSPQNFNISQRLYARALNGTGTRTFGIRLAGRGDTVYSSVVSTTTCQVTELVWPSLVSILPYPISSTTGQNLSLVLFNVDTVPIVFIGEQRVNVTLIRSETTATLAYAHRDRRIGALQAGSKGYMTLQFRAPPGSSSSDGRGTYSNIRVVDPAGGFFFLPDALYYTDDCPTPGFYGRGEECKECPDHATCPGGYRLWPDPGYWTASEFEPYISECRPPEACLGGRKSDCAEGYSGDVCGVCMEGYFKDRDICLPCTDGVQGPALIIIEIAFAVAIVLGIIFFSVSTLNNLLVALSFVQLLRTVASAAGSSLPGWLARIYHVLALSQLDIAFVKPDCLAVKTTYLSIFWGTILQEVLFRLLILLCMPLHGLWRVYLAKRNPIHNELVALGVIRWQTFARMRVARGLIIATAFSFFNVVFKCLQAIYCIRANQQWVLAVDPSVQCYKDFHIVTYIVAWIVLLFTTVAFPHGMLYFMHKKKEVIFPESYGPFATVDAEGEKENEKEQEQGKDANSNSKLATPASAKKPNQGGTPAKTPGQQQKAGGTATPRGSGATPQKAQQNTPGKTAPGTATAAAAAAPVDAHADAHADAVKPLPGLGVGESKTAEPAHPPNNASKLHERRLLKRRDTDMLLNIKATQSNTEMPGDHKAGNENARRPSHAPSATGAQQPQTPRTPGPPKFADGETDKSGDMLFTPSSEAAAQEAERDRVFGKSTELRLKYGYFYERFRPSRFWMQVASFDVAAIMAISSVVLGTAQPTANFVIVLCCFIFLFFVHIILLPLVENWKNYLTALALLGIVLLLGLNFASNPRSGMSRNSVNNLAIALGVLYLIILLAVIVFAIVQYMAKRKREEEAALQAGEIDGGDGIFERLGTDNKEEQMYDVLLRNRAGLPRANQAQDTPLVSPRRMELENMSSSENEVHGHNLQGELDAAAAPVALPPLRSLGTVPAKLYPYNMDMMSPEEFIMRVHPNDAKAVADHKLTQNGVHRLPRIVLTALKFQAKPSLEALRGSEQTDPASHYGQDGEEMPGLEPEEPSDSGNGSGSGSGIANNNNNNNNNNSGSAGNVFDAPPLLPSIPPRTARDTPGKGPAPAEFEDV